jgi:iron complex outermembrane receptor protein
MPNIRRLRIVRTVGWLAAAAGGALLAGASRAENPAEVLELPQVGIVGTTPLPGSGIALRDLPANAQIYTSRDLRRQGAASITDFLERNGGGVGLNAAQGNPYQPDVNVRGFSASPLLGTPQGVSVFFDGVRINEPFGDTVNWDLIPQSAISSIQLIPGSNPAFGLNTLGGAVAVYTKSGASEYPDKPGFGANVTAGSFGLRRLVLDSGGKSGSWDWFATANDALDRGWALHNQSRVRQLFAKIGWQDDRTDLDLSFSAADNRLEGTQTLPASFDDPRQPYTYPDTNTNRVAFLAFKGSHALTDSWLLSGNAYLRRFRNRNVSSNVNEAFDGAGSAEATNDAASIDQTGQGAGLQFTGSDRIAGRANKLVLGLGIDEGRARFRRSSQDAQFTPDRGTIGTGSFMPDTDADSKTRYGGVYASDALSLDERWTLTLAGRFNRADIRIADRSGIAPELDGQHRYTRFNPALGLTFNPSVALTTYASYNEGMRAPTAIELTCADRNAPCKLPNNFLADPALKMVVSKTFEVGARGKLGGETKWSAALFRTDLRDDLQFISSTGVAVNAGYFQNVGTTRRQGLELGASTRLGSALAFSMRYDWIDATYRTGFVENSPANSSADANGAIVVQHGSRIPAIPRQSLKLRADFDAGEKWSIGANALVASSIQARGDENNLDVHGRVPGYARLDLDTRYRYSRRLDFFGRIDNALNRRYANFGILGTNVFTGPSQTFDAANPRTEQFLGRGVPRSVSTGLQYLFD